MEQKEKADLRAIYDEIAESWYGLRHWTRFRRELEEVAERWQGGRLLNVGCAHGPDFLPFAGKFGLYGLDFSARMIEFAHKYARKHNFEAELIVGDARCLPFRTGSFDCAISVAAYHNIRGAENRRAALAELNRVLRPGGEAFLTVWNRWQPAFLFAGNEVMVPWRKKGRTLRRYYYLYTRSEFVNDLRRSGFEVLSSFPEHSYRFPLLWFSRNICAAVRKRE